MRHQNTKIFNVQKLCSNRKHGSNIECQHGDKCFANSDMTSNTGNEEEWETTWFLDLANAGPEVEHIQEIQILLHIGLLYSFMRIVT